MQDDQTLTAYHEAGHGVIAYALGGHVESLQLGGEADEWLPDRFGECRINWGPVDPRLDWQRQREILAILAGPVAEMVVRDESLHPSNYGPWQHDWRHADLLLTPAIAQKAQRNAVLDRLIDSLHRQVQCEPFWSAIAAVADELAAHESLAAEQIDEIIGFWFRRHRQM